MEERRSPVLETFLETAGLKAIVLVGFLFVVTVLSAIYGVRAVEGLLAGAGLAAVLAAALVLERLLLRDRVDFVGFVVLAIVIGYTALEYTGTSQDVWFPVASAGLLAVTVSYEAWRWLDDPDMLEFFGEVDIVGLYGVILLMIYSLLLVGGQLDFIYSPYFPAVLFVFVATVLVSSVSYLTGGHEVPGRGELHERLISVVRGLDEISHEDREPLVNHVRAVANAINGVQLPTKVMDGEGSVPVVLPLDRSREKVYPRLESTLEHLNHKRFTGYLVNEDGDVVLFKNGRPCKYYFRELDRFGTAESIEELPEFELGRAHAYNAPYSLVDSVEAVTPSTPEERRHETEREEGEPSKAKASASRAEREEGLGRAAAEALGRDDYIQEARKEAAEVSVADDDAQPISEMVDEAFEKYERKARGEPEPEDSEPERPVEEGGEPSPAEATSQGTEPSEALESTGEPGDGEPTTHAGEQTEESGGGSEGVEESDDDSDGDTLNVGGEEINVQEMVDLADEVMDELEDL